MYTLHWSAAHIEEYATTKIWTWYIGGHAISLEEEKDTPEDKPVAELTFDGMPIWATSELTAPQKMWHSLYMALDEFNIDVTQLELPPLDVVLP